MATLKAVILKGQKNIKGDSNIKVLITHKRKTAYLSTEHYVKPSQMGKNGKVIYHPNAAYLNQTLMALLLDYQKRILQLGDDIHVMTAMDIKKILLSTLEEQDDFYTYAERRISELKEAGKATWISYNDSIKRLKEYATAGILPFKNIDRRFLEGFELHCLNKGRKINSIALYMRSIRALFYDAMEDLNKDGMEPFIKNNPFFRRYRIKTEPTKKRSLQVEAIIKIRDAELTDKFQNFARDMFMLDFYLIGINIKDLFYYELPINDRIIYKRYKTKRGYSIRVEPEAKVILDRYQGKKYLLKFADHCGMKPKIAHTRYLFHYFDHRAFNRAINVKLKDICSDLGISEPVSTYYARHSWATIARNVCAISKDDIALCLGHKDPSKNVTDIYLNEDLAIIDRSNRIVLDLLNIHKP